MNFLEMIVYLNIFLKKKKKKTVRTSSGLLIHLLTKTLMKTLFLMMIMKNNIEMVQRFDIYDKSYWSGKSFIIHKSLIF